MWFGIDSGVGERVERRRGHHEPDAPTRQGQMSPAEYGNLVVRPEEHTRPENEQEGSQWQYVAKELHLDVAGQEEVGKYPGQDEQVAFAAAGCGHADREHN